MGRILPFHPLGLPQNILELHLVIQIFSSKTGTWKKKTIKTNLISEILFFSGKFVELRQKFRHYRTHNHSVKTQGGHVCYSYDL